MSSLVSPGVEVTVTDESFFIPQQADTIPLFFIATASEKKQPDGLTSAAGTFESNVIRTVTSLKQSLQLFGVPRFLTDSAGNQQHGDARNEYGLLALNQYLSVGDLAYVIRANVNLDDDLFHIRDMWDLHMQESAYVLENIAASYLNEFNLSNGYIFGNPLYKQSVSRATLLTLINAATQTIWLNSSFINAQAHFKNDSTGTPMQVYPNGFNAAPSPNTFIGVAGDTLTWTSGSIIAAEWTPQEAGDYLLGLATDFAFTQQFRNDTSLGANDAARRMVIKTALQAAIMSNTDISSEIYEYNLIACPGYYEVKPALLDLTSRIDHEAFVIADLPFDLNPDDVVTWMGTTPSTSKVNQLATYYPHAISTNVDGVNVFAAASGIALATMVQSDELSYQWFAPAGVRRGVVASGVVDVGYISGTLGTATTFNSVSLNKGQRNNLYRYPTNINPVVNFPGIGILLWGQKTQQPSASALDRINVSRLLMYIKRRLRKASMSFVFEPNDQTTRDNLKVVVDGFLGSLVTRRGLYDFATVCDDSNNTPFVIDNNELIIDVALKPVKAAEFITIPIRVLTTGASFG
jgi:hypothetical protein